MHALWLCMSNSRAIHAQSNPSYCLCIRFRASGHTKAFGRSRSAEGNCDLTLREHDAIRWRIAHVGSAADGTFRLDDDRAGLWALDSGSRTRCGAKGRENLWSKCWHYRGNAGKLMPAPELSTGKNQALSGGEGGIRTRLTARLDAAFRVSVTKK